jgi:transposase-like protein
MRLRFWRPRINDSSAGRDQWRCVGCRRVFTYPERPEYASSASGRFRAWCSQNCLSKAS